MQIVIDIDDMAYKFAQDTSFVEDESTMFEQTNADRKKTLFLFDILSAIKNGTPLPKGHGRLLDEKEVYRKFYSRCLAKVAKEILSETDTIIEADKVGSEDKECSKRTIPRRVR